MHANDIMYIYIYIYIYIMIILTYINNVIYPQNRLI